MFGETFAQQYQRACAVAKREDGTGDELIAFCREIGAVYEDGPDPEDECFVVTLRPEIGPELWTADALRKSMKGKTP